MRGCKAVLIFDTIADRLKVELNVIGLQASDLLLVLIIDVGKDGVFALGKTNVRRWLIVARTGWNILGGFALASSLASSRPSCPPQEDTSCRRS